MLRAFALACATALATFGAAPAGPTLELTPKPFLSIPVLLFHQVSDTPIESAHGVDLMQRPWATPTEFDHLLRDLQAEGYRTISSAQVARYVAGTLPASALPPKPLVLTFDDGYRSAWTEATPILRKHRFTATMYFEGHAVDNPAIPGRLGRADLRAMAASGVWELQSHGWAGHSNITIDAKGTLSPYWYANLAYLRDKGRLETLQEFEARVQADLLRMRRDFASVAPDMTIFAYPSGEYGQNFALAPGEDARIRLEAGHSNAQGLQAELIAAMRAAGYTAAVAVSNPGSAHFAGRADSVWAIPRVGVGAAFTPATLAALDGPGVELPEHDDLHYLDVGPVCVSGDHMYAASTVRPEVFTLDSSGKVLARTDLPQLVVDRPDGSPAVGGLACDGSTVWLVQQAGFNPNPQPYLVRLSADGNMLKFVERSPIEHSMNWLCGIAARGAQLYGIDDQGNLFEVRSGKRVATVAPNIGDRGTRFTGLAPFDDGFLTVDRKRGQLLFFTETGSVRTETPFPVETAGIATEGTDFYASIVRLNRRSLRLYRLEYHR